ncbi:MAG TPA: FAD-dependent oxidoreductase, partial [Actinomycetota bacterium]|nr:FAD-dependent oxidoreductase [Actinomycetota bacterium]
TRVDVDELVAAGFDEIVLATGVTPRIPDLTGVDHPRVVTYLEVLRDHAPVGKTVAILGAGGIGFDVAEYLTHDTAHESHGPDPAEFNRTWGIDTSYAHRGGLTTPERTPPDRQVTLLQRKTTKVGAGLGKTTGWIHRTELKQRGVRMLNGVNYERIDDAGVHISVDGEPEVLEVDTVVLCTGQESRRNLAESLRAAGLPVHVIGGADEATELDAKRAIRQGTELAASL